MNLMASKKKRLIPADLAGNYIDTETVLHRNQILESAGLDNFLIRLPRLKLNVHFYYKFVEDGECTIIDHGHWHWEITRICSGKAAYSIQSFERSVLPDASNYLIIPPKVTHSWRMTKAPLLEHSWQVRIAAEDHEGEAVLDALRQAVIDSNFLIPASSAQIQAETLLWEMAGEERNPQIFGTILSGFARIVLGDLLAKLKPWPANLLADRHDPKLIAEALANRLRVFLDENLKNPITLKDLEGHFHYSERHLNRIFQKVHLVSIGQYLRQQRVDLSKQWLETTDRSIKDIALSLGYSNPGQFCRYFRAQTNLTPSQYRARQQAISSESLSRATS